MKLTPPTYSQPVFLSRPCAMVVKALLAFSPRRIVATTKRITNPSELRKMNGSVLRPKKGLLAETGSATIGSDMIKTLIKRCVGYPFLLGFQTYKYRLSPQFRDQPKITFSAVSTPNIPPATLCFYDFLLPERGSNIGASRHCRAERMLGRIDFISSTSHLHFCQGCVSRTNGTTCFSRLHHGVGRGNPPSTHGQRVRRFGANPTRWHHRPVVGAELDRLTGWQGVYFPASRRRDVL